MLGPYSGIGSARVVVARRAVSLLSNRTFGAWITWTQDLCCGIISRLWTKNSLIGFCSGEGPLAWGPIAPKPYPKKSRTFNDMSSTFFPFRIGLPFLLYPIRQSILKLRTE